MWQITIIRNNAMRIERNTYLNRVIESRHNHMIKIITGVRRSGKSYLLFNLFPDWLKENGVTDDHIIKIDLENKVMNEEPASDRLLKASAVMAMEPLKTPARYFPIKSSTFRPIPTMLHSIP